MSPLFLRGEHKQERDDAAAVHCADVVQASLPPTAFAIGWVIFTIGDSRISGSALYSASRTQRFPQA
jgi:hypothetical protein